MQISATIITFNEESISKPPVSQSHGPTRSSSWTQTRLTRRAKSPEACGARVITNEWPGFGAQKQFAVNRANTIGSSVSMRTNEFPIASALQSNSQKSSHAEDADGYVVAGEPITRDAGFEAAAGIPITSCVCSIGPGPLETAARSRIGDHGDRRTRRRTPGRSAALHFSERRSSSRGDRQALRATRCATDV